MEISSPTIKGKGEIIDDKQEKKGTGLPHDIVSNIISRMSVKHVFQLQCLSKNFSSITKDRNFINTHLRHSARLRPSIIVSTGLDLMAEVPTLLKDIATEEVPLFYLPNTSKMVELVGSCNGLVVVVLGEFSDDCFLVNPATNKYVRLPSPSDIPSLVLKKDAWGFGYCAESSVYKIVRIASYYSSRDCELVLEVLTYGTDREWRRVDFSIISDQMCFGQGITVKGVVYWKPGPGTHNRNKLLSFDLEKEEFAWFFCPVLEDGQIMEFRGLLSVCVKSEINENYIFDIWVLKDKERYGDDMHNDVNENTWEKIHSFDEIALCSKPLLWLNDSQLLLFSQRIDTGMQYLYLHDLEHKTIMEISKFSLYRRYHTFNFTESLVPLSTIDDDSQYYPDEDGKE